MYVMLFSFFIFRQNHLRDAHSCPLRQWPRADVREDVDVVVVVVVAVAVVGVDQRGIRSRDGQFP